LNIPHRLTGGAEFLLAFSPGGYAEFFFNASVSYAKGPVKQVHHRAGMVWDDAHHFAHGKVFSWAYRQDAMFF
jgi:hypothetical protein